MGKIKILVLVKQVTDTRQTLDNVFGASGVINRDSLPAVFNPEDLNALEVALSLRETVGGEVVLVSMGPARAAELIREGISRGADSGVVLCDRRFAGADTLATSHALAQAARKIGADVIFAGRQSIDGDTGHVGAQVAQQLGMPQITYAESVAISADGRLKVVRRLSDGTQTVLSTLPAVVTVSGSAKPCRPCNVHRMLRFRKTEVKMWSAEDLQGDSSRYGSAGSPTRVIASVKYESPERVGERFEDSPEDIDRLCKQLMEKHLID